MNANTTAAVTFETGQFLAEPLVTDTLVYEVVKTSASSVWVRRTQESGNNHRDVNVDQGPFPLIWQGQKANPDAEIKRLGIRKDGSIRMYAGGSKLRLAPIVGGEPVRRVDYRY